MFAYDAYKKHKERKEGANPGAGDFRKLSTDSDRTPLGIDMDPKGLERKPTFLEVKDKKAARKQLFVLIFSLIVDVVLPIVLYYILKSHISLIAALLISSAPPAISVVVKAIIFKRVDPLGIIIIFGFAISAIISVVNGEPRVLLLRESVVTSATGALFLLSLIPFKIGRFQNRPLNYGVTAQMLAVTPPIQYFRYGEMIEKTRAEFCWEFSPIFRKSMRIGTLLWGLALEVEFGAKLIMYFSSITIDQFVLYGNIAMGVIFGTMTIFTVFYSRHTRKQVGLQMEDIKRQLDNDAHEYQAEHAPYGPELSSV
ncbi:hypothetical protein BC943DRAFT_381008 [Umbelopsis sp. AD052]|nr:hypothetical protein BC943DRAFT_381008 [Umbelopsis sp. AD052]